MSNKAKKIALNSDNFKLLLCIRGKTSVSIAEELGIHVRTVQKWCSNNQLMAPYQLKSLADCLDVPVETLNSPELIEKILHVINMQNQGDCATPTT